MTVLFQHILPDTDHHYNPACDDCIPNKKSSKIITGYSIHNMVDVILFVLAFAISTSLGITVAVSIFVHEFI
jgi:zinc transporter ZupT